MKPKQDTRPRFGWRKELDRLPQTVWEKKVEKWTPVVVIPLPYMSPKIKKQVREFVRGLNK